MISHSGCITKCGISRACRWQVSDARAMASRLVGIKKSGIGSLFRVQQQQQQHVVGAFGGARQRCAWRACSGDVRHVSSSCAMTRHVVLGFAPTWGFSSVMGSVTCDAIVNIRGSRGLSDGAGLMDRHEFEQLTDTFLLEIEERLVDAGLDDLDDMFDIVLSQGVLTISLGDIGTWVINKQAPNRQVWWSSPVSGPKRFEWNGTEWVCTRDGEPMIPLLRKEFQSAAKVDIGE